MKKTLTLLIIALLAIALPSAKKGSLEFAHTAYDFGNITDSHAPVVHEYDFINISDQPVAILSVTTGCGCTRPEYPIKPVDPGKTGKIKITFLPKGQRGSIDRHINVRYRGAKARSSERTTLRLQGSVTPDTEAK